MKKAATLGVVVFLILITVAGCGRKYTYDFNVENHAWVFSNVLDSEAGVVIGCSEAEKETYPEVEVMDLTCEASDYVMALGDGEGNSYEVTYRLKTKNLNARIYDLVYENEDGDKIAGTALSSVTEYYRGKYEYTMIIDLGGYALYFTEKID